MRTFLLPVAFPNKQWGCQQYKRRCKCVGVRLLPGHPCSPSHSGATLSCTPPPLTLGLPSSGHLSHAPGSAAALETPFWASLESLVFARAQFSHVLKEKLDREGPESLSALIFCDFWIIRNLKIVILGIY